MVPGFLEEEASALEQERGGTVGHGKGAGQCCREGNTGQGLDRLLLTNRSVREKGWKGGWEEGER